MKRVTLFCGHYGSGKTNVAVNMAAELKRQGKTVALADIDIVNPYFRSADSRQELEGQGIEVIALPFAGSNVDLPALPQEVYGLVQRRDVYAVLDVGGDDRGAYALGRYVPYIREENNYEMLFVVNFCRPLTRDVQSAVEVLREIEAASQLPFTGIVNNTNLGDATTAETVESSLPLAQTLSEQVKLPICFTAVKRDLAERVRAENVFPLKLQPKLF
ncbi:MAG: hypothetical protein IJS31_06765 [Oscillospiraceae bacterium]|nr:hypothetical protein [Oscillospiraceae bacterium]